MMARLGEETGLRLVATNDSHYLDKDDAFAHEVLLCIGTGKTLGDEKRMKFYSRRLLRQESRRDAPHLPRLPRGARQHA